MGTSLKTFQRRSPVNVSADALFLWHARPGALERLTPPWQPVELASFEGIEPGDRAVLKIPVGPLRLTWIAEHRDYVEGRQFKDVQIEGPFAHWEHTHRMIPDGPGQSILEDSIEYALPLRTLAHPIGGGLADRRLAALFAYRHRITRQDLALHSTYSPPTMTVAITGASGLIGSALRAFLTTGGHRVVRLVRTEADVADDAVYWNPETGAVDRNRIEGLDAVVHLAGEPVATLRLTAEKKRRILESRMLGTRLLSKALARLSRPPRVLVSASGIGYYGDRGATIITEDAPPGNSFLADVCQAWEAATTPAEAAGIRVLHARMGPVLSPLGGALKTILPAFKLGLGGMPGSGDQYFSWLMLDDAVAAIYHLMLSDSLSGPVNVVTPKPVPFNTFARTLGRVLHRPSFLRIPRPLLRALGGEAAEELALTNIRAVPERLLADGFSFLYPDLEAGLRHQLGKTEEPG